MRDLALAALLALAPAAVHAQAAPPAAGPQVEVRTGPALAAKTEDYGARELAFLNTALARTLRGSAAKGGWTRLDLVLEDAVPNRPTYVMLGRSSNLSLDTVALGGAQVTGTAYGPAGAQPLRFGWWDIDLRDVRGFGTWTGAERAFQALGGELARGRVPDRLQPAPPTSRPSPSLRSAFRAKGS